MVLGKDMYEFRKTFIRYTRLLIQLMMEYGKLAEIVLFIYYNQPNVHQYLDQLRKIASQIIWLFSLMFLSVFDLLSFSFSFYFFYMLLL